MASKETLNELTKRLERIKAIDRATLIIRSKWGELNFEDCKLHFDRTLGLVDQLGVLPIELLPDQTINPMRDGAEQVANALESIDKFSIQSSGNVNGERQHLANQFKSASDTFFSNTAAWLPYLAYQRGDVERNIQSLTESVRKAELIANQAKGRIAGRESEMDGIITKAREASAAVGAAVFTQDFKMEADQHEAAASSWIKITLGAAILTLLVAGAMWVWTEPRLDQGQLFQKLSTKLVGLAVLLSATIWCGRNYKALKHLATVNRHRSLSIQTLQAFSAAASDPQTKDAVLLEATRAVFGNTPTGYIEGSGGDSDLKIVEVARSFLPRPDKQ
jgi:hypothetical protein